MEKPGGNGAHAWIEDCTGTQGAADTLCEEELVILGGNGGHHEAENVHKGAEQKDVPWAVVVKELAHNGTLDRSVRAHKHGAF